MNEPDIQTNQPKYFIGNTTIEFDPQLRLTEKQKLQVTDWHVLTDKLADRAANRFEIFRLVVKAPSFVGEDDEKIILLSTRLYYREPKGRTASYHGVFMPDGAALLEIYRVIGRRNTVYKRSNHYALMVSQARTVANVPTCLEVPVGMIEMGETPSLAGRREHFEESGASSETDGENIHLGSVVLHNSIAERQHQFLIIQTVTEDIFRQVRRDTLGRKGGLKTEGEETTATLVPIEYAYRRLYKSGESAGAELQLGKAMDYLGLDRPFSAGWQNERAKKTIRANTIGHFNQS